MGKSKASNSGMGEPNNSFNRSANSVAFIRKGWVLDALHARPVNSGVMSPLRVRLNLSPAAPLLSDSDIGWIIERLVESG